MNKKGTLARGEKNDHLGTSYNGILCVCGYFPFEKSITGGLDIKN